MQSRQWLHGSAGQLGVFGATRYFTGRADDCDTVVAQPAPDRLTQAKVATHDTRMIAESFRDHDDEKLGGVHELELASPKAAGKSKLAAAFSSFMLSPSPGAGFRRRMPQSPTTKSTAAGDESMKFSLSSTSSSRDDLEASAASVRLEGPGGYGHLDDLGVATGDRRLQGVKVVRSDGGDEERWVVRCCAPFWDQEEETMFQHRYQHQG
jgi:hypothetical protein